MTTATDDGPLLGEMAHLWLEGRVLRGEITDNTARYYRLALDHFVNFHGPARAVASITPIDLERWITAFATERPRAKSTLATYCAPLRAFLVWCHRRGYVALDPTADVRTVKTPRQPPKRLSREVVQQLLTIAPRRERTMILVLAGTGLRRSELLAMRVEDIDLQAGLVTVLGKGSKERVIPLVGEVAEALADWTDYLDYDRGPLWPSPHDPDRPLGGDALNKSLRSLGDRIGHRITAHMLRHTCASDLVEEGVDLAVVQALLGHTNIATTSRYLSASPQHVRASLERRRRYRP